MPVEKPSDAEDAYFARLEFEKKQKVIEERERQIKEEERRRLRDLHHMRCPKCGMELVEIEYREVKIDKCSVCAGIWLDSGELERIMGDAAGFLGGVLKIFKG